MTSTKLISGLYYLVPTVTPSVQFNMAPSGYAKIILAMNPNKNTVVIAQFNHWARSV